MSTSGTSGDCVSSELLARLHESAVATSQLSEWLSGSIALALLEGAICLGILDLLETPRTPAELAERIGLAPDRADSICAALSGYGILKAMPRNAYQLSNAFRALASRDALQPLPDFVAGARAYTSLVEFASGIPTAQLPSPVALATWAGTAHPESELTQELALSIVSMFPEIEGIWSGKARILEVGCGIATFLLSVLATHPNITALGIDKEPTVVREAQRRAELMGVSDRVSFVTVDATSYRTQETFDCVCWSQKFFSTDDRAAVLSMMLKSVKLGGYLLVPIFEQALTTMPMTSQIVPDEQVLRLIFQFMGVPILNADELRLEVENAGFEFVRYVNHPTSDWLLVRRPVC